MPTSRQLLAANCWIEALSQNQPITKANVLRLAGYSRKVQRDPRRVFESQGFQMRINATLPLEEVARVHRELLYEEDPRIAAQAVELGYRLHGYL